MITGSPNLLIVGPGRGLESSHNAIWWNLLIFFYVEAENRMSKRRLDGSLAKFLRALDLGSALDFYRFPKSTQFISGDKETFEKKRSLFYEIKKNIFSAMFFFCLFFRRSHYLFFG